MRRVTGVLGLAAVVSLSSAATVSAQPAAAPTGPVVTVGYQFQRFGATDGTSFPLGGFVDLALGGARLQGVVQFGASVKSEDSAFSSGSSNYSSESTLSSMRLMAGVRTVSRGRVAVYGHALGGILRLGYNTTNTITGGTASTTSEYSDAESKFSAQLGAGVIIPAGDRTHWRLGLDYQRVFVEGGGNIYVASVGFGFRLRR